MTKIFINPGHSLGCKPDAGCCYNNIKEAEICAELSNKVTTLLQSNGFDTEIYQQCGDKLTANQQLNNVPKVANASKADLFVSIHMNGFTNPDAKGVETWFYKGSSNGEKLAKLIQEELTQTIKGYTLANRGAKIDQRGLLVLRSTNMTSVLIEVGFISNKAEALFIQSNLKEIAQKIARAICRYYNKSFVEQPTKNYIDKIELTHQGGGRYDCSIDGTLKLSKNKLSTCLKWVEENYA